MSSAAMLRQIVVVWIGGYALISAWAQAETVQNSAALVPQAHIRVYFTPGDSAEAAIVEQLLTAKDSILVQAYSFTNPAIANALVDAQQRGVRVVVLLDKSQRTQRASAADFTSHGGVETLIDDRHAIAHNKIMIIDGQVVITGSYNFTRAAEKSNAENMVIIESPAVAAKYLQNWQKHRNHSLPYRQKSEQ